MAGNWTELYRRAMRQGGVVTSMGAAAAGIPKSTFHRRIRTEGWHEVFPGAWLVPGARLTLEARHWAAILSGGRGAVLSHSTAARLHGLDRTTDPNVIHVVRKYGLGAKRHPGLVRHRSRSLEQHDHTKVDGLRVTTAARTLLDVAPDHRLPKLEAMMLEARQRGLVDHSALIQQHGRRAAVAGAANFLTAANLLTTDGADSVLERRARKVLAEAGLHPTDAPHPVTCGDVTLYVDIAFPGHRYGIECDGFAYHGPDKRDAFERDRRRWRLLKEAGWEITWLTWLRLHEEPASFVAEVRRNLEGRAA